MITQIVSHGQCPKINLTNSFSEWNGKRVDPNAQRLAVGADPSLFNGAAQAIILTGIIFASVVAALAVLVTTGSVATALITCGIVGGGGMLLALFCLAPKLNF